MQTELVSPHWLNERLNIPDLKIIQAKLDRKAVTIPPAIATHQIPGTIVLDIKEKLSDITQDLPNTLLTEKQLFQKIRALGIKNSDQIVVYDSYGIYSSPRVWWILSELGFKNVAVLDGGLPLWMEIGYPLEPFCENYVDNKVTNKSSSAVTLPSFRISTKEEILQSLNDDKVIVIDARSSGRFYGKDPEPREGLRGGHIPNSINLPFTTFVQDGSMLSKEELMTIFKPLVSYDKKLIFTCGSGITACIVLLAAKIAGYQNLFLYDGSWSEWGSSIDLPVSTS